MVGGFCFLKFFQLWPLGVLSWFCVSWIYPINVSYFIFEPFLSFFLAKQHAPGSSCVFPASVLKSAISLMSPGSFFWRTLLETKIWVPGIGVAIGGRGGVEGVLCFLVPLPQLPDQWDIWMPTNQCLHSYVCISLYVTMSIYIQPNMSSHQCLQLESITARSLLASRIHDLPLQPCETWLPPSPQLLSARIHGNRFQNC